MYTKLISHIFRRFTSTAHLTESIPTIHFQLNELARKGLFGQTLQFYKEELYPLGLHSNSLILPSVIKAASSSHNLHLGLQIHCIALKSGSDSDTVVSNALISMYGKASLSELAYQVFDTMPHKDTISWNSIINRYIQNGYFTKAVIMFVEMYTCGLVPKSELIAAVISICLSFGDSRLGRAIHALVLVDGRIDISIFVSTSLVDFYLKCCDMPMAFRVFDRMEVKNEVSWTAMVSGCVANLEYGIAFDCFRAMQFNGVRPNRVTLIAILPACAEFGCLKHGKEIHGYSFCHGFNSDKHFLASLIDMYCKTGEATRTVKAIFDRIEVRDVVLWSSVIAGYSRTGDGAEAMKLFAKMLAEGIEPNSVTLLAVIAACTTQASVMHGSGVHGYVIKRGLDFDISVCNALVDMYSKCGSLEASRQTFEEMHTKDTVSWSSLISCYGLHSHGEEALSLFHEMQEKGTEPDSITFLAVLSACNHSGLIDEAQKIFDNAKNQSNVLKLEHYACQIDMLGKSGKIEDAFDVLRLMPMKPSSRIWSSLISACKMHGKLETAEILVHQLIKSEPNNAANYTLLSMIYVESGNWHGVEEVRRVMRMKGLTKCYGHSQIFVQT